MQVAISQKHLKISLSLLLICLVFNCQSQNVLFTQGFAHNDYWHQRPLYDALENGYSYVEADIYLRNNKLIVAHILPFFKKKKTLEQLYFKPLLKITQGTNKEIRNLASPITLMIDIKSEANETYSKLEHLLHKYASILSSYDNGKTTIRQVTVIITGHKPYKRIKEQTSRMAFIDEDLLKIEQSIESADVYQTASCKYAHLINWQGIGEMPLVEKEKLIRYVSYAHQNGKKVRLWASPENTKVWAALMACGVDLINTDQLVELRDFLLAQQIIYAKTNVR
ncbi:putative secreted protein [Arcticibacter svalbardensis MN12-7]|uniref:Altered inheritance of mitochondria protein 6 n=1 Tax=Arcticibacter svalbardensis MN12-7 TaxID=1150600 RepID=R9GUU7_9SPHI|nr:phosphatidylinositol-specific phospholipase C/glycerophosphodiester phosphodiesterase family protein [Arcticibacter svalbardensis]EOR92674.1 putative secreted protein [Arcticibacter svalbardensis MN12-7]